MNKQQILENIRIKSDLRYDLLFESSYYSTIDKPTQEFLKENYNKGVNFGLEILKNNPHLISENMDEAFWDRLKATGARALQGVKNVTGIGTQTADSKDAGINSLFNSFKAKFDKTPGGATSAATSQPQQPPQPAVADQGSNTVIQKTGQEIEDLDKQTQNLPPIPPQQAVQMVQQANVPKSLKDKLMAAIRNNPGKTRLIIGGLSMAAGAAGTLVGVPPQVSGAVVNGIGTAVLNKAQGKSAMTGLAQGALAGIALGTMGAGIANGLANLADTAATKVAGAAATTPQVTGADSTGGDAGDEFENEPSSAVTKYRSASQAEFDREMSRMQQMAKAAGAPQTPEELQAMGGSWKASGTIQGDETGGYNFTPTGQSAAGQVQPRTFGGAYGQFEENINLFKKTEKNNFKLQRNILNEALTDEQKTLLQDFINDLAKKLNQSPQTVIQFMKSQGDRYKQILDYLPSDVGGNRNMATAQGQQPQQGQPQGGQPGASNVSPALIKNINTLKSSKLFSGNLEARISSLLNVKYDVPAEKAKFDALLKSLNGIINAQSANVKKKIGDPNAILTTLKEAETKDYLSMGQDISAVMPAIVDTAFLLRQSFSNKNPKAVTPTQGGPQKNVAGAVQGKVNEQLKISTQELTTIKYFLSQLIQVGNLVKNTNVQDPTQLKNLFRGILTLVNIVSNKNVKGVKLNNKVDVGFQGKDILGAGAAAQPEKQVKKGPGNVFKESDYKKFF